MMYKDFAVCCGHDVDYYYDIATNQYYINRKGQYVIKDDYIGKLKVKKLCQDWLLNTNDSNPDRYIYTQNGLKIYQYNTIPAYFPELDNFRWIIVSSKYANACIYNNWSPVFLDKLLIPETLYKKVSIHNKVKYIPIGAVGFIKAFFIPPSYYSMPQAY